MTKHTSRRFKLFGGALLLLSFIAQTFVYDYWDGEMEEYMGASRDQSAMIRSALQYEILYFTIQGEDSMMMNESRRQFILAAARKVALGSTTQLAIADAEQEEVLRIGNEIWRRHASVRDYPSFVDFMGYSVTSTDEIVARMQSRIQRISDWKDTSRWLFVLTYVMGTVLFLWGSYHE
jgi:hypothetical protein